MLSYLRMKIGRAAEVNAITTILAGNIKTPKRQILTIVLLGLSMIIFSIGCEGVVEDDAATPSANSSTAKEQKIGTAIGNRAPIISVSKLDGSKMSLSDYTGRAIVLNVWATWCGPCRAELPVIQAAYDKYHEQGVEFLGINMRENSTTVQQFISQRNLTFPILLDADGSAARAYNVQAVPTTYFIDGNGIVRSKCLGEMDANAINTGIELILKKGN